MNLKEIIFTRLKAEKKSIKNTGYPYIITNCLSPKHNDKKPSFSINYTTGVGKCFSCGYSIGLKYWTENIVDEDMLEAISTQSLYTELQEILKEEENHEVKLNKDFIPPLDTVVEEGWRGFTKQTIELNKLYITTTGFYKNRVIMPILNNDKEIIAYNTRAIGDEQPKYLYNKGIDVTTIIYPNISPTSSVLVVEGMLDALSLQQMGYAVICNFGVANNFGKNKIKQLLQAGVETLYLAFDNDEAGEAGMDKLLETDLVEIFEVKKAKFCIPELIPYYTSGCKDFNEYLQTKETK